MAQDQSRMTLVDLKKNPNQVTLEYYLYLFYDSLPLYFQTAPRDLK